jgi:hypothetical protein
MRYSRQEGYHHGARYAARTQDQRRLIWLIGWSIGYFLRPLHVMYASTYAYHLIFRLIDWLIGCADWLIYWLIYWFIDCMIHSFVHSLIDVLLCVSILKSIERLEYPWSIGYCFCPRRIY